MNYAKAQKDVLASLVKHPTSIQVVDRPDEKVGLLCGPAVCYIFPDDTNWIDTEKIAGHISLSSLPLPLCTADNKLEKTDTLIDRHGELIREFKRTVYPYEAVYIKEAYLKNFDEPILFQDCSKPKGLIVVDEISELEGETTVGYVMPYLINEDQ